jgi:arginase
MHVDLIVVPFDSAQRGVRMGAGPEALLAAGLPDRLASAGHRVTCLPIELPEGSWRAEVRTAFDLAARIAERVRAAREGGRMPVVLAGNCSAAIGVVAGLGHGPTVCWCDAHGDFNTPETTTGGFLDGMALAIMTGRCWVELAARVPGFAPVTERDVWLVGARDLDAAEAVALERSAVRRVEATAVTPELATRVRESLASGAPLYLHVDIDVLDVSEGRANSYAAPGGVSARNLLAFCQAVGTPAALTLSAYDPKVDTDGRVGEIALHVAECVLGSA